MPFPSQGAGDLPCWSEKLPTPTPLSCQVLEVDRSGPPGRRRHWHLDPPCWCSAPPIPTHRAVLQMCWGRRHPGAPRGHSQVTAAQTRSAPGPSQPWDPGPWARKGPYLAQQDGWTTLCCYQNRCQSCLQKSCMAPGHRDWGQGWGARCHLPPPPPIALPLGRDSWAKSGRDLRYRGGV